MQQGFVIRRSCCRCRPQQRFAWDTLRRAKENLSCVVNSLLKREQTFKRGIPNPPHICVADIGSDQLLHKGNRFRIAHLLQRLQNRNG